VATDVNSDVSIDASSRSLVMLVILNFSEHCMLIRINMETDRKMGVVVVKTV